MERVILDTDILSEILKRRDPVVVANAESYIALFARFSFTAVSVHEIIYGLQSKRAIKQLNDALLMFAANEVFIPMLEDYIAAGRVRGTARTQGNQLALDDCLIAAVAARLGLPVVTGNTEHFQAVISAGLPIRLENWRESPM